MKKIKLLSMGTVLFLAFSCTTNDSSVESGNNVSTRAAAEGDKNPYSYVGKDHNTFLAEQRANGTNTMEQLVENAFTSAEEREYETTALSKDDMVAIANQAMNSSFEYSDIEGFAVKYNLSSNVVNNLNKLSDVLNNQDVQTPTELLNDLTALENSYLTGKFSETDKAYLLSTIAVAKSSTQYWLDFYNIAEDGSEPNNGEGAPQARIRWFARIFGGVLSDVLGAVLGAGVGTLVAGPAGTAAGAYIGAVSASGGVQFMVDDNL